MINDRRTILSLIAMGRITPREAERLLALWPDSSETAWVIGACSVMVASMVLPHAHELSERFADLFRTIFPMAGATGNHALSFLTRIAGGKL